MVSRLTVNFENDERRALNKLAEMELRDPREEIRFIVRMELQKRGLLDAKETDVRNVNIDENQN